MSDKKGNKKLERVRLLVFDADGACRGYTAHPDFGGSGPKAERWIRDHGDSSFWYDIIRVFADGVGVAVEVKENRRLVRRAESD
jgi:hypothetical protein